MSESSDTWVSEPTPPEANPLALELFEQRLATIAEQNQLEAGKRNMWLAHHWPADYQERCVTIGGRHVCRRCAALYPLGLLVAVLSAYGLAPWPESIDPWPIWLLSIPATVVYCGEAVGLFRYRAKIQVGTTLLAAAAFGRALGYEFVERWNPMFWQPVMVFGLIWFFATMIGNFKKLGPPVDHRD